MTEDQAALVEQRVRERHEADLAEARRHLETAERESHDASEAYLAALDAERDSDTAANARRTDAAYNRAIAAVGGAIAAKHRVADLSDPTKAEHRVARERERTLRLVELRERKRAERDAEREKEPAPRRGSVVTVERGARSYPTVEDTGDGLAALDRGALRELAKKNGVSVGGHKATLVARLREAGVTA